VLWPLNTGLLVLCGFLAVDLAGNLSRAFHAPPRKLPPLPTVPPPTRTNTPWSEREVILTRNLFEAPGLTPPVAPPAPEQDIEESELPVGLLGTVAAGRNEISAAAIWNAESHETRVVRTGDSLANGEAVVIRIDRGRLLLSEDGATRELLLDRDGEYRPPRHSKRQRKIARKLRERRRRARR
jgi:hypothetical protein